jgi:hypothetical protein
MNGDGENDPGRLGSLPGLARVAATAWWHTTEWALSSSMRLSMRLARAAISPAAAGELLQDARVTARDLLRQLIELADLEETLDAAAPAVDVARKVAEVVPLASVRGNGDGWRERDGSHNGKAPTSRSLREEGEALLRRSRDVNYEEEAHPAYERILTELAPDEGRILRLLLLEGPQPAVDVRTGGPVGLVKSRLIAPGLNMIGARAGCRYLERVPAYLNNLFRLGMVWFSRETLNDPLPYQVLEAQPDVLEAIHSVRQAKVVRRSIHLTPFGEDFCRVCLMPEDTAPEQLPEHSSPPEAEKASEPPTAVME